MATGNVQCPHCGAAFEVSRKNGKTGGFQCPQCSMNFSSADGGTAAVRPAPRQSTPAPAAVESSSGRWLVGGLILFGLVGLLSVSCIGVIWLGVMAKKENPGADKKLDDQAKVTPKTDDDAKKKIVNLDVPFKPKPKTDDVKKPDPDKEKKPTPITDSGKKPDPDKDKKPLPSLDKVNTKDKGKELPASLVNDLNSPNPATKDAALLYMLDKHPDRIYLIHLMYMSGHTSEILRSGGFKLLEKRVATFTRKDIDTLRNGLKSPAPAVQILFVDAVAALKADGAAAAPELAALLASPDGEVISHVAKALDDVGKLVWAAREAKSPAILAAGIDALRKKRLKTDEVFKIYETNLTHEEQVVKTAASLAVLELAPERLRLAHLADMAANATGSVRVTGEKNLRARLAIITAKELPDFKTGLKHTSHKVKLIFIDAVPALKDAAKEVVPELTELVDDAEIRVAKEACKALGNLGKTAAAAIPVLTKALESSDKDIAVAATLAIRKIDPANKTVANKGIDLLLDDLRPDIKELKTFIANPLASPSAAQVLDLGEPAVKPLIIHLMQSVRKKNGSETEQTAKRLMAYKFLIEFAKRADLKDAKLVQALRKFQLYTGGWADYENGLRTANAKNLGLTAEVRDLYTKTSDAAFVARTKIATLREPPPERK